MLENKLERKGLVMLWVVSFVLQTNTILISI